MSDNKSPIPNINWVNYYLQGISLFFPKLYHGEEKGQSQGSIDVWKNPPLGQGVSLRDFYKNLMDVTNTNSVEEAFVVVKGWKSQHDKQVAQPDQTTPGEIDLEEQVEAQESETPDQARARQEQTVREWIEKRQEVTEVTVTEEDTKNLPNIYLVATQEAEDKTIPPESAKKLATLIQASKKDSTKFANDLTKAIIVAAPEAFKQTLSEEELRDTASIAAIRFTAKLRSLDDSANGMIEVDPNEILVALSNPERADLKKLISDPNIRLQMAAAAQNIALTREREDLNTAQLLERVPEIGPDLTSFFIAPSNIRSYSILSEKEMINQTEDTYAHKLTPKNIQGLIDTYKQSLKMMEQIKQGEPVAKIVREQVLKNTIGQNPWFQPGVVTRVAGTTETVTPSIFGFGTVTEITTTSAEALATTTPGKLMSYFASNGIELLTSETVASPVLAKSYTLPLYGGLAEFGVGVVASDSVIIETVGFRVGKFALGISRTWIPGSVTPKYAFKIAIKAGKKSLTRPVVNKIGTKVLGLIAKKAPSLIPAAGVETAALAGGGFISGLVSFGIGLLIAAATYVTTKVLPKIKTWVVTHKKDLAIVPVVLVVVGLTVGGTAGSVIIVTGLVSGAGYLTMAAGGVIPTTGLIGGGVYTVVQGFTNVILPAIAIPVAIIIMVTPIIVAIMVFIINATAYVMPPPITAASAGDNPYIDVSKVPNPTGPFSNNVLNNDGQGVEYTITITAKKTRLSNIRIEYDCHVAVRDGSPPECPNPDPSVPSTIEGEILANSSASFSYKQKYSGSKFDDSLVTDIITVTADSPDQPGVSTSGQASICFGNCPQECPSDWPVAPEGGETRLTVTIGPDAFAHAENSLEAIDINTDVGHTVRATHSGKVTSGSSWDAYGKYVKISSTCDGHPFVSIYAHLSTISVGNGSEVKKGQIIGATGRTSQVPEYRIPHLHYEFSPGVYVKMVKSFIPKTVPVGCFYNCDVYIY